jgi:Na+/H+ antiporter NhaD/arsenite permease-like protein
VNYFPLIASASILAIAYVTLGLEKLPKAVIALLAATAVLLLKLLSQDEAFAAIDFNVVFLLTGMMIIVDITSHTGVFQWIAIKVAKMVRGQPLALLIVFSLVTAVLSALLDNVTTVLLVGPVSLLITRELRLDPVPFMISEALASNIGGTATLVGDPPNIMIGSAAHLNFMDFITNLAPGVIVILIAFVVTLWFVFRKRISAAPELRARIMSMDEKKAIKDKPLLYKSLVVVGLVITAFLLHGSLGYEAGEIALAGAAVLLLLKGGSPEETLKEVDWTTILFFIGLFIVVGATVKAGLINILAKGLLDLTKGNPVVTGLVILWASAFLSAFIDNIPYVATMIPLILALKGSMDVTPLWWALSLGACLGGNGTLVGASANVVISGIAGKSGYPIHFLRFTKYGMPIMIQTLIISSIYLLLRYYMPLLR